VADSDFGYEDISESLLVQILREAKKTDPIGSKMILNQAYENTFGIYDYVSQAMKERNLAEPSLKEPLSSVSMHYAENYCETSRLYELIQLYEICKIYQIYRISLSEFLEYPHDLVEYMLKTASEKTRKESKQTENMMEELKEGLEG
jgi:hypothetical protein